MKTILSLALLALMNKPSFAATFEIYGPCSDRPLFSQEINLAKFQTIGDVTVYLLEKNRIPYKGNEKGINQIFNSPLGLDAIEVLSDTKMNSYGWCYTVDDEISMNYADEFYTNSSIKKVKWFYAYSELVKDQWISMCKPSHLRKPEQFCNQSSKR